MAQKAIAQYIKRAKYNLVVCDISGTPTGGAWKSGAYIKPDQFYSELFIADTNNFWYDISGNSNIIAFNTFPNIAYQQIYLSQDKQTILTFKEPISGKCEEKALKYLGFNESYNVEEGSYLVTEGEYKVYKPGIVGRTFNKL